MDSAVVGFVIVMLLGLGSQLIMRRLDAVHEEVKAVRKDLSEHMKEEHRDMLDVAERLASLEARG